MDIRILDRLPAVIDATAEKIVASLGTWEAEASRLARSVKDPKVGRSRARSHLAQRISAAFKDAVIAMLEGDHDGP